VRLNSWPEIGSDGDVSLTPYVPKGITGYDDDDDDDPSGPGPPRSRGFLSTNDDAPLLIAVPWTSEQLVAETST
jgi:hypothetical protein